MKILECNDNWKVRIIGENVYQLSQDFMETSVPSSIYGTLLEKGLIPDPFYRDNELTALKLMENDFEYQTTIVVTEEMLTCDALLLTFEGIDTIADIYVNDSLVGQAYNMFRTWEFDILDSVSVGENTIRVIIYSPTRYIREENEKVYTGGSTDSMEGYPHLRKAHCMFGWDWGPRLPDAGIFRKVFIKQVKEAMLDSVYITQNHEENLVKLDFTIDIELIAERDSAETSVLVTSPTGQTFTLNEEGVVIIHDPMLWWPNGYGEQPLYEVKVTLFNEEGSILDIWEKKIGLRTITVDTSKDEWGNQFAHCINGVNIFAMGADYIPEDNILSRVTPDRTRKLLEDCVEANFNSVRVWGGGYYPNDFFFDICDELGLLVWQDFMYACSSYELEDEFEENIVIETIENVRRIRHHACLALWCGNNEMETQTLDKSWKPSIKQTYDYIKIFEYIIPKVLKEEDPNTFYWPSSPSSGGNFDNPWDEFRGDTHYWDVWHGNKPFTEYRKFKFRYLSEFGFQSFPCLKTVETFTEPEDRNIFSRVMEMHQRNAAANGKIMNYLSATYLYPKDFDSMLYTSQLLQAEAIRYGVEHFRRYRGQCMGSVVWQLNDIWPVASWASIDYFGRWKALHYAEKRMFAPILISCEEIGELSERPFCVAQPKEIEKSARLNIANETMNEVKGVVKWALRKPNAEIIVEGEEEIIVQALSTVWLEKKDFTNYDELSVYFSYEFVVSDNVVSQGSALFTAPKHFKFENPHLSYQIEGKEIIVKADAYTQFVEIQDAENDLRLSDNFFHMDAGEKRITILEGEPTILKLRSVYHINN